jgi:hypothetical protein
MRARLLDLFGGDRGISQAPEIDFSYHRWTRWKWKDIRRIGGGGGTNCKLQAWHMTDRDILAQSKLIAGSHTIKCSDAAKGVARPHDGDDCSDFHVDGSLH